MYGLQHGALAHIEQQAIKGPRITSVKHRCNFMLTGYWLPAKYVSPLVLKINIIIKIIDS